MNLKRSLDRISQLMSLFLTQVKADTAMGKTDINKVAETVLIPLFTEVYSYTALKNLNYDASNYPGIDLGDETARVAFQITSTPDSEKIKKTLRKFTTYKLYKKYDRLIIYILTEKQKSYSGSGYEEIIQGKFAFDKDNDIWDYRDILREVANFQIDKARKVESILEANFGEGRTLTEWEVVDNVERIVNEYSQLFVGREEESQKLDKFFCENSSGLMLVTAGAGFGKTALLANWVNAWRDKDCFIAYHFFTQRYRSVKSAYRNLLRQLYIYYKPTYEQIPNDEEELKIRLYNLLREYAAREAEPLIIVIDGLDEAENTFSPPFPNPLPENVYVIASARAEEGDEHKYLEYWTDNSQKLNLSRLSGGAIAQWLRNTDELTAFADDTHFVAQLDEITQGFPLYLRYLTEELSHAAKQGQDVREVLAQTPKGFERYVEQQLRRLDELDLPDERWQFFALLAVAKGVLEKEDVKALTGMRDKQLRQLHHYWQVTRWMRITEGKLYAFAHPLLGKTFAAQLGDDAEDALQDLIDYCARWQEHHSRYALRHYAEHLRDVEEWEEFYAIARDKDFAVAQREQLPDEPDLSLKTVQAALLGAAETDNAGAMAEFMLVHARQLMQTTVQESPLDALRSGSLDRSLALADLYEIERCVLWYLLLAWELKDKGKLEETRETLKRLQRKKLPRFSMNSAIDWQGDYAAYFLAHVFEVSEDICTALEQQLLDDRYRRRLCRILSNRSQFKAAIETALKIGEEIVPVFELEYIAKVQAEKGQREAARATFAKALEITRIPIPNSFSVYCMGKIAETQIEVGDREAAQATFTEALARAYKIANPSHRVGTFVNLADMQAEARMFTEALDILQQIDSHWGLEDSLMHIAKVEAKSGEVEKARVTFTSAKKMALGIEDKKKQVNALLKIAKAQVEVREFTDDALKTAEEIGSHGSKWDQAQALEIIAITQAQSRDLPAAFVTARRIEEPMWKTQALKTIAIRKAEVSPFTDDALEIAQELENESDRTEAWLGILKAKAEAGNFPAALEIKNRIQDIKDESRQQDALATIGEAYAKAKNFDAAFAITKIIDSQPRQLRTLGSIAKIQAEASLLPEARATFATVFKSEPEPKPEILFLKAIALAEVAEVQVKNEQKEVGADIARDIQKIAQSIENPAEQANVLAGIAQLLVQAGKIEEAKSSCDSAFEIAQKISKNREDQRSWSFKLIAQAQARVGEFDAALRTLPMIKLPFDQAKALRNIAQLQVGADAQQRERWKTILSNVHKFYENPPDPLSWWDNVEVLSTIAVARVAVGDKDAALATLSELYEAAQGQENRKRDKNLSTIAAAQAEVEKLPTALKITDEIEDESERVKALSWIAWTQFKQGEKGGLLTTLAAALEAKDKIKDEEQQVKALRSIAGIQAMAGKGEEAVKTAQAILTGRNLHLPRIASWFVETGNKENFKQLLIPCAYYFDAAYQMCGHLARLYPEKAEEIAKVMSEFN